MKKIIIIAAVLVFIFDSSSFGQTKKVREYLGMVAAGKINEAEWGYKKIAGKFPDDPGVIFLGAVLETDARKAIEKYNLIIDKYPDSEWADDSYWRVVQYYAVLGDLKKANEELDNYRQKYPTSEFIAPATDVVRSSEILAAKDNKKIAGLDPELKSDTVYTNKTVIKNVESTQNFGLQVGVYSTRKAAQAEMKKYRQKRLETKVVSKTVEGLVMFAVVIGNYSTKQDAEAAKSIVGEICGCKPLIIKKK